MLPLHKDAQGAKKDKDFHAGLWYERFFNGFLEGAKKPDENNKKEKDEWAKNKSDWIKSITAAPTGKMELLEAAVQRQVSIVQAYGGTTLVMNTDWHFVTGLGNNHPVENGFAWHHTLGVPYLTGAAVKGLLRGYCEVWLGWKVSREEKEKCPEKQDDKRLKQWFGDTEQSGGLIFFDALPTRPVQLKADIMTPHYGDWYAKGNEASRQDGSNVPADWHDPNPIPFLVVDKGQPFQFAVARRKGYEIALNDVIDTLAEALQRIGAGAKTAAGYGCFSEDMQAKTTREKEMREKQRQKEEQLKDQQMHERAQSEGLTGVALDAFVFVEKLEGVSDKKRRWLQEGELLLERLQDCENPDEKAKAVSIMLEQCERFDPGIVANPDKRKGKKQKPAYKDNAIKMVKALLALSKG
jgi:CRISPR-associated protein Cmr6